MPSVAVICPVHIRLDETVYLLSGYRYPPTRLGTMPLPQQGIQVDPLVCRPKSCYTENFESKVRTWLHRSVKNKKTARNGGAKRTIVNNPERPGFTVLSVDGANSSSATPAWKQQLQRLEASSAEAARTNGTTKDLMSHGGSLPPCADVYFDMLVRLKNFFLKHSIKYSLFHGTLLGSVREQNLIPWESDFDVVLPGGIADVDRILALQRASNELRDEFHLVVGIESRYDKNRWVSNWPSWNDIWLVRVCEWWEGEKEGMGGGNGRTRMCWVC